MWPWDLFPSHSSSLLAQASVRGRPAASWNAVELRACPQLSFRDTPWSEVSWGARSSCSRRKGGCWPRQRSSGYCSSLTQKGQWLLPKCQFPIAWWKDRQLRSLTRSERGSGLQQQHICPSSPPSLPGLFKGRETEVHTLRQYLWPSLSVLELTSEDLVWCPWFTAH